MPMTTTMNDILHPGSTNHDPVFPNAPDFWTQDGAIEQASSAGLELTDDHWEVIRVLQACYAEDQSPPLRRLRDALEARFSPKGGCKYLFRILPDGPIMHGCTLAGLEPPVGSTDSSFGTVS